MPYIFIRTTNAPRDIQRLAALQLAPGEEMSPFDKISYPTSLVMITTPDAAVTRARLLAEGWREDELRP
ncbi:hypothetical protein [Lacimonas salitolerans]|uniref:Signal transducing protein n=1 Tax=Lacimonas salitolerans TaxID=1323750 RepID=A0ABW4EDN1_9RHOB